MNANTAITTAARRIARETNASARGMKLHFDANGKVLDRHPADQSYTTRQAWATDRVVTTVSGAHITYRAAQDFLDAAAYAATQTAEWPYAAEGIYLDELATARSKVA